MKEPSIVCERDALTSKERVRQRELISELTAAVFQIHEVEDGLVLHLPAEKMVKAAELMSIEKRCCRFLKLRLETDSLERHVTLTLTGPPGTKALLESELVLGRAKT